ERIVRRELIVPFDLAGLRLERQDRAGVQIVARTHRRIERPRVADAPINRVQLRVIGAGDPCRSATELPGIAFPGVAAGLLGAGYRVGPPQALARLWIPTIDEPAGPELRAGNARDDNAVRDERSHGHRIAFLDVGRFLTPQFLAGLHVECNDVGVERGAEKLAVVNRTTAIDNAATDDARRLCRVLDLGLPDLFAGFGVNSHRSVVVGDIDDALVHQRLRLRASVICEAVVPHRHQVLYVILVDLRKR